MKTNPRIRQFAWALAFTGAFALRCAHADIYTWVDSAGKLNLSNQAPPEGTRITNVFREDPAVRAGAEAARAAAERDALRALNERVKQLEQDLDAAKRTEPAPVVYVPAPAPAPAPYPSIMAQAIVAPAAPPIYANCNDPWGSCFSPGSFGFYPGGIVVLNAPAKHRFRASHRGQERRMPAMPSARFPTPVGALGDPVNLFPNIPRR